MNSTYRFLRVKKNRELLAWIGGALVVVCSGIWSAVVFFAAEDAPPARPATIISAPSGVAAEKIGNSSIDITNKNRLNEPPPGQ